jgi:DNA polymerase III epsilon subunit-like protein
MTVRPRWNPREHSRIVFVDTETTGLDAHAHEIFEVGMFVVGMEQPWQCWQREVDLRLAEPEALIKNRYYERRDDRYAVGELEIIRTDDENMAFMIAKALAGAVMVGINPSFDAGFLNRFLLNNRQAPAWKYHVICAKTMAMSRYIAQKHIDAHGNAITQGIHGWKPELDPTWNTSWLAEQLGIEDKGRHTALGDVYVAIKFFEYATGFDFGVDWE